MPSKSFVRRGLWISLLLIVVVYLCWQWWLVLTVPLPIRVFRSHRARFETIVRQIADNDIEKDENGYLVPTDMYRQDVRYMSSNRGCIFFSFAFWPDDSIEELVFSPTGADIVVKFVGDKEKSRVSEFATLDDKWFYVRSFWGLSRGKEVMEVASQGTSGRVARPDQREGRAETGRIAPAGRWFE